MEVTSTSNASEMLSDSMMSMTMVGMGYEHDEQNHHHAAGEQDIAVLGEALVIYSGCCSYIRHCF